jgi:alkyl hydroperoxide reductase subunit D
VSNDLESLKEELPAVLRDIRLNIETVLGASSLTTAQRWGVALASAASSRNPRLTRAVLQAAGADVDQNVVDDALAAAGLMAMNNVFYRFRHFMDKPSYQQLPARLRMTRIARPATNKADFELFCLAVSAINGCEMCVRAHEEAVLKAELTETQVLDAVRVASTIHAAAVSLELAEFSAEASARIAPPGAEAPPQ